MENILNKEPVLRVQKKLDEYNKNLKAIVLNSSARTAQEAAEPHASRAARRPLACHCGSAERQPKSSSAHPRK
mgnify:CR=1 FL=1